MNTLSTFRNPSQTWRMGLVAGALAMPGFVGGAMLSLLVGRFALCAIVGTALGALLGAAIEGWPLGSEQN